MDIRQWAIGKVKFVVIAVTILCIFGLFTLNGILQNVTNIYQTSSSDLAQSNAYNKQGGIDNAEHGTTYETYDTQRAVESWPLSTRIDDSRYAVTDAITGTVTGALERVAERTGHTKTEETKKTSVSKTEIRIKPAGRNEKMKQRVKGLLALDVQSRSNQSKPHDIMTMKAINFDPAYKNPCWKEALSSGSPQNTRLHCLPYFYIIGVKKSGTTDFYARLLKHPEVCYPGFKESQWMTRLRFGINAPLLRLSYIHDLLRNGPQVGSVDFYASMYDKSAKCIKSHPRPGTQNQQSQIYKYITGDATPALMHMHTKWEVLPGNVDLDEPTITNFHYIKHITPDAKIIVLFRDPVSRLYSDFHHVMKMFQMNNAPQLFHEHVTKLLNAYTDCFRENTFRQCIYNNTLRKTLNKEGFALAESFIAGFYAFFMKELFSVFRRDQILPLLMLDFIGDTKATMETTFRFLKLKPLSGKVMEKIVQGRVHNSGKSRKDHYGDMFGKTKSLLTQFYKPYNEEMAALMGDKRYAFDVA